MASIRLIVIALFLSLSARAQTFAEWFAQKSTQRKYLMQQIAELYAYRNTALRGYHIAKGGLGSIGGYLGDEYSLHQSYYNHLQQVSPIVRNDSQVKDILTWEQDVITATNAIKRQPGLTREEQAYVAKVCQALLTDCENRLNDLTTIINDGKFKMSDEERLRQIGLLHQAMLDNYRFAAAFSNEVRIYAGQKQREQYDITTLTQLYGKQ